MSYIRRHSLAFTFCFWIYPETCIKENTHKPTLKQLSENRFFNRSIESWKLFMSDCTVLAECRKGIRAEIDFIETHKKYNELHNIEFWNKAYDHLNTKYLTRH